MVRFNGENVQRMLLSLDVTPEHLSLIRGRYDEKEASKVVITNRIKEIQDAVDSHWIGDHCIGKLRQGPGWNFIYTAVNSLLVGGISRVRVFFAGLTGFGVLGQQIADTNEAIRRLTKTLKTVNELSIEHFQEKGLKIEESLKD